MAQSRQKPRHGLRWEPTNEQEVVMLFGRLVEHLPRPLIIESIGTTFPDCRATDARTDKPICIEFELNSSHFFRDHAGRQESCHWVVCWRDDAKLKSTSPRIIALDKILQRVSPNFILNRTPRSADRRQRFQLKLTTLPSTHQTIIQRLLDFDWARHGLEIAWPETDGDCFTVREVAGLEYFKVGSRGTVGIPFSRWKGVSPGIKTRLTKDLNHALDAKDWVTGEGKKSRDIGEIMRKPDAIQKFISIWTGFADQRANQRMEPSRDGS